MRPPRSGVIAILLGLAFIGACSTSGTELKRPAVGATGEAVNTPQQIQPLVTGEGGFTLRSEAFEPGQPMDEAYTFPGGNAAPPLSWENVPADATELALVMRNADQDDTIYWVVTGISPDSDGLIGDLPPPGAVVSENEFGEPAYRGPDSRPGVTQTYVFTLYALAEPSGLAFDAEPIGAVTALEQSAISSTSLSTTFTR